MDTKIFDEAFASLPESIRGAKPACALMLGSGWSRAVEGLDVVYPVPFNGGPSGEDRPNVLVTVIGAAAGDVVELTGSTLAGFSVRIRGGTGYVSRAINWIAQGY